MFVEGLKEIISIKNWAEEDRPREKFMLKGKNSLSDAELLAILLGSGSANESAVDLARRILMKYNNNLHDLAKVPISELQNFKGIGEAKAITIAAALELGRRRKESEPSEKPQIRCSKDAFDLMKEHLMDLAHEEFWIAYLNRNNRVVKKEQVGKGGIHSTGTDVRLIVKSALDCLCTSIILFHNHPSGNAKPSNEDFKLTKKIKEAANVFDIEVSDHIIFYEHTYTSLSDEGQMP